MLALFIKLALQLSLIFILLAEGMEIARGEVRAVFREPGLFARSFLSVIVIVPLAEVLIVRALSPPLNVTVGLGLLASCPIVPVVMNLVKKAHGDERYGRSLHVVFGALSILTVPAALYLVSRATGFSAAVHPLQIADTVFSFLLLPLGLGFALREVRPRFSERWAPPIQRAALVVLTLAAVVIIASQAKSLAALGPRSYLSMLLMVLAGLASGHLLAPKHRPEQTTLAIESAARNPAIAVLLAELNFPDAKVVPVLVPYLVTFVVVMFVYRSLRRRAPGRAAVA